MATSREKKVKKTIAVNVDMKDIKAKDEKADLTAYLFSRSGQLLEKKPVDVEKKDSSKGKTEFNIETTQELFVVKVGPDVEDIEDLARKRPVVQKLNLKEVKKEIKFPISEISMTCWKKKPYHVTGDVEKYQDGKYRPVCVGEVDIYEVDIHYCFIKIPDIYLEEIRNGLIDILLDPPQIREIPEGGPSWVKDFEDDDFCGTGPKPFPPKNIDIIERFEKLPKEWAFSKERHFALPEARNRMSDKLQRLPLKERQTLLSSEAVKDISVSEILYSNTNQFRQLIIDNFESFRYCLCWYPWIHWIWWPWCKRYSREKIGTAELQADGSFSKTILLSVCDRDIPDLWFVVRQTINNVERIIYRRYPIPCNTYWNHPSGKPVRLIVHDPDAVACDSPETVPYEGVFVMPTGVYEDEWYDVHQAHLKPGDIKDSGCGLYNQTDPYGTRLDLRMMLHDDLRSLGVYYYRWSYRKEGSLGAWTVIDTPIVHRYMYQTGTSWNITVQDLGPKVVSGEPNLFRVPNPNKIWLSNRDDLAYAIWYTSIRNPETGVYEPQVPDGRYQLKLEMFNSSGNIVKPVDVGFRYILATGPTGPVDDNLHVESDGSLLMNIHVNNKDTVTNIKSISINGNPVADCQFLVYNNPNDIVDIEYEAYHPSDFLAYYNMNTRRGVSSTLVDNLTEVTPALASPPAILPTKRSNTVSHLLREVNGNGPHSQCSFTARVHSYPRTRNGHGRIRAFESSDSSSFTIIKGPMLPKPLIPEIRKIDKRE